MDPLLIRTAGLYLPLAALGAAGIWRRTASARMWTAALLAALLALPSLLAVNLVAMHVGWWNFGGAHGALFLGMPIDLYLAWVVLWGPLPALAAPRLPLAWVVVVAVAFDLGLMPLAAPVVELGPAWLLGEAVACAGALVPAQLLARWTFRETRLYARVVLQMICFSGLLALMIPAIAVEANAGQLGFLMDVSGWKISLLVQAVALPSIVGLAAVQEFASRGRGTPLPFDPPTRLVTTGPYAYVSNPMQIAACLIVVVLAAVLQNAFLLAGCAVDIAYGLGLPGWHERSQMRQRFGDTWLEYRRSVRAWWPRWRPFIATGACLYVDTGCVPCSQLGGWLVRRAPVGLDLLSAEEHPENALRRLTYVGADGVRAEGVAAFAYALDHLHLGWAFVGWALRLPVIVNIVQVVIDAAGSGPRTVRT